MRKPRRIVIIRFLRHQSFSVGVYEKMIRYYIIIYSKIFTLLDSWTYYIMLYYYTSDVTAVILKTLRVGENQ